MRSRIPLLLLALAASPFTSTGALLRAFTPGAHAGEVERGEHIRLSEEMRKLAQRNAWGAVEANYVRLEELAKKGEVIAFKDHMLGAESARALGDTGAARSRLSIAIAMDPKKEAIDWIADIDANFGRAKISFDPKYGGERILVAAVPPFAPDQRTSVEYATRKVAGGGNFDGLLPAGDYTIGTEKLTVKAGPDAVASLLLAPAGKPGGGGFKLAYAGPRATFGVAFTNAGAPGEADASSADALQAGPFGGGGARLGLGVEAGLSKRFGIIAEVGYHNLFGAAQDDGVDLVENEAYVVKGNSFHMGYGWLAASLRFGNVWLAAGPVWGVGKATVTGNGCVDCAALSSTADQSYARYEGDVLAGGAAASISYGLVDLGKLRGALTLEGGAQTDSHRTYPWGQLALTIAPATPGRTE